MRLKYEQDQENIIYIHKNLDEEQAKSLLFKSAKEVETELGKANLVDGQKLWLLRHSSVAGLITFESIEYNKKKWEIQMPTRYMNSALGWVINNNHPNSAAFAQIVEKAGGKSDIVADNNSVLIESLVIHIIDTKKCSMEDHITPLRKKETNVVARSRYLEEDKDFTLPGYIAKILICPLTKEKAEETGFHGNMPLMKNPVVLKDDGKSYERDVLVKQYKELGIELKEGVHYYTNIVLKNIIGYLASQEKSPGEYLEMLEKVDEEVLIDSFSLEHFKDAVISPSGFSYSKGAITTYIDSKKIGMMQPIIADPLNNNVKIGKLDLIPNENLELFMRMWPDFYQTMSYQMELQ